jgi:hypothetical protein
MYVCKAVVAVQHRQCIFAFYSLEMQLKYIHFLLHIADADTVHTAADDSPYHVVLFVPKGMGKLNNFRE